MKHKNDNTVPVARMSSGIHAEPTPRAKAKYAYRSNQVIGSNQLVPYHTGPTDIAIKSGGGGGGFSEIEIKDFVSEWWADNYETIANELYTDFEPDIIALIPKVVQDLLTDVGSPFEKFMAAYIASKSPDISDLTATVNLLTENLEKEIAARIEEDTKLREDIVRNTNAIAKLATKLTNDVNALQTQIDAIDTASFLSVEEFQKFVLEKFTPVEAEVVRLGKLLIASDTKINENASSIKVINDLLKITISSTDPTIMNYTQLLAAVADLITLGTAQGTEIETIKKEMIALVTLIEASLTKMEFTTFVTDSFQPLYERVGKLDTAVTGRVPILEEELILIRKSIEDIEKELILLPDEGELDAIKKSIVDLSEAMNKKLAEIELILTNLLIDGELRAIKVIYKDAIPNVNDIDGTVGYFTGNEEITTPTNQLDITHKTLNRIASVAKSIVNITESFQGISKKIVNLSDVGTLPSEFVTYTNDVIAILNKTYDDTDWATPLFIADSNNLNVTLVFSQRINALNKQIVENLKTLSDKIQETSDAVQFQDLIYDSATKNTKGYGGIVVAESIAGLTPTNTIAERIADIANAKTVATYDRNGIVLATELFVTTSSILEYKSTHKSTPQVDVYVFSIDPTTYMVTEKSVASRTLKQELLILDGEVEFTHPVRAQQLLTAEARINVLYVAEIHQVPVGDVFPEMDATTPYPSVKPGVMLTSSLEMSNELSTVRITEYLDHIDIFIKHTLTPGKNPESSIDVVIPDLFRVPTLHMVVSHVPVDGNAIKVPGDTHISYYSIGKARVVISPVETNVATLADVYVRINK